MVMLENKIHVYIIYIYIIYIYVHTIQTKQVKQYKEDGDYTMVYQPLLIPFSHSNDVFVSGSFRCSGAPQLSF